MQLIILALLPALALALGHSHEQSMFLFANFVKQHGKAYTGAEFLKRFAIFEANLAKITAHNALNLGWKMGMNQFGDLTADEFKAKITNFGYTPRAIRRAPNGRQGAFELESLPATVDWTTAGAVTAVKDQGQCGSCWSFSTTGSVEGINYLKTKNLVALSEQQLMDCSTSYGNSGCNGGLMDDAFQYVIANKGLATEAAYPYTAAAGTCQSKTPLYGAITGFTDVTANSEDALQAAVAQQPVSVAIEADQDGFQFYTSGVFSGTCGTNLDHGVLAVGYGTENGTPYWLVKNSWAATWGDNGYIKLVRGSGSGKPGQCGIAMDASYPTM